MSDNQDGIGKHRAWFADEVGEFPGDVPLEPLEKMVVSLGGTFSAQKEAFEHLERAFSTMLEALELISDTEPDPDNMGRFHDIANDAIAKAKGLGQ